MKDFFSEAPYSDISFEVESEIIKAHKWCLIKRNKFFANMFASNFFYWFFFIKKKGGMAESQTSTIKITDVKAQTFKGIFSFFSFFISIKISFIGIFV